VDPPPQPTRLSANSKEPTGPTQRLNQLPRPARLEGMPVLEVIIGNLSWFDINSLGANT
jgi:hypothetical protein